MTPVPAMFDYELRLKTMNERGVDVCIVSLTCPNCYWGGPEVSLAGGAHHERRHGRGAHRVSRTASRWFASLPWQYPELALAELERAVAAGASGVMVLANIDGKPLTDPAFESIWSAIDARALPVLVHPTAPPGVAEMDMQRFQLTASIGFTFDTSLAVARMIYDGFFDRYREAQDHRVARRRRAAVPHLAHGPVLRQHSGVPREDLGAADRIHAADLRRRGGVLARTCSSCASRSSAPTTCSTARTIRTPSATCRVACKRVERACPTRRATRCAGTTRSGCSGCSARRHRYARRRQCASLAIGAGSSFQPTMRTRRVPERREQQQARSDDERRDREAQADHAVLLQQVAERVEHVDKRGDHQGAAIDRQRHDRDDDVNRDRRRSAWPRFVEPANTCSAANTGRTSSGAASRCSQNATSDLRVSRRVSPRPSASPSAKIDHSRRAARGGPTIHAPAGTSVSSRAMTHPAAAAAPAATVMGTWKRRQCSQRRDRRDRAGDGDVRPSTGPSW